MQRIIIIYSTIIVFSLCKQDSKGIVDVPCVIRRVIIRQTFLPSLDIAGFSLMFKMCKKVRRRKILRIILIFNKLCAHTIRNKSFHQKSLKYLFGFWFRNLFKFTKDFLTNCVYCRVQPPQSLLLWFGRVLVNPREIWNNFNKK